MAMALKVGQDAPEFAMKSNKMQDVKLSALRGSKVLLLFVPLAFTGT
jgi:peroxiredoxin